MRLQFSLQKITLSASCHIQFSRHAEQYINRYAAGQLYGELYDDIAHITNILTFPEPQQMSTKEELQGMEVRHKQMLNNFNMDTTNLGWFMVSYYDNYWDSLEAVKYYEKYINTSFFLIYDYQAKIRGKNPYRGFRLTDQFIGKEQFTFSEILKNSDKKQTPFLEIAVQIEKDQIFQAMMLFNRKHILQNMKQKHKKKVQKSIINDKMEKYMGTLEQSTESNKVMAQKVIKDKDQAQFSQYCHYLSLKLKAMKQEETLKSYEANLNFLNEKLKKL